MTAAAGPGVGDSGQRRPDGRALSRWGNQLFALGPCQIWVGTLDLCHLDAAVRVSRPRPLDPFHRHVLAAAVTMPRATAAALDARLGVGPTLGRLLGELNAADLVQFDGTRIVVTPRGERALTAGTYPHPTCERRRFTFLIPGPHYLPWLAAPGPHDASMALAEIEWLVECVSRPAEWKRRAGFPEDVETIEPPAADLPPTAAWRRVAVVRSERVAVVLAMPGAGALHAFVPDSAGGLHADAPALRMADGWGEPFLELAAHNQSAGEDVGDGWRLIGSGRLRRAVPANDKG
jgi:hypothetical protein